MLCLISSEDKMGDASVGKTFTRKAAGATEAFEKGLTGDPRRISRVVSDSRAPRDRLSSS